MSFVPVTTWWRRLGATRLARHGRGPAVTVVLVLVLGLAALAVGLMVRSGALAALGIVLAVPQTIEAGRNLRLRIIEGETLADGPTPPVSTGRGRWPSGCSPCAGPRS